MPVCPSTSLYACRARLQVIVFEISAEESRDAGSKEGLFLDEAMGHNCEATEVSEAQMRGFRR